MIRNLEETWKGMLWKVIMYWWPWKGIFYRRNLYLGLKIRTEIVEEAILPPEIVAEILSRLEAKSLLVLRCVCKLWRSIIDSGHFTQMHSRRADTKYMSGESLCKEAMDWKDFMLLRVSNGLMLEKHRTTNQLSVRNPATKTSVDLPKQHDHIPTLTSFVHLRSSDKYKVVTMSGKTGECKVLTLAPDLEWRRLEIPNLICLKGSQLNSGLFWLIDEVLYVMWFSGASRTPRTARDIVCIDMETEVFETVTAPEDLFSSWEDVWPLEWKGKLGLYKEVGEELHVWMLEDYKTQRWAEKKIVISVSFLSKHASNIPDKLNPWFCSEAGWLHFQVNQVDKISYHIETGKEIVFAQTSGGYYVKFRLVNPFRSSPTGYE